MNRNQQRELIEFIDDSVHVEWSNVLKMRYDIFDYQERFRKRIEAKAVRLIEAVRHADDILIGYALGPAEDNPIELKVGWHEYKSEDKGE